MTQTPDQTQEPKPGTYDHTEEHTRVYSHLDITSNDTEIDRAWARLYDRGYNAGPAMSEPHTNLDGTQELQYFLYARATRDLSESNVNKTVVFHFGTTEISESGL